MAAGSAAHWVWEVALRVRHQLLASSEARWGVAGSVEEVTGAEVQGVGGRAAAGKAVEETVVAATALVKMAVAASVMVLSAEPAVGMVATEVRWLVLAVAHLGSAHEEVAKRAEGPSGAAGPALASQAVQMAEAVEVVAARRAAAEAGKVVHLVHLLG